VVRRRLSGQLLLLVTFSLVREGQPFSHLLVPLLAALLCPSACSWIWQALQGGEDARKALQELERGSVCTDGAAKSRVQHQVHPVCLTNLLRWETIQSGNHAAPRQPSLILEPHCTAY
jgi:hypothetical protein